MIGRKDAVLLGPFVGELYWEVGRFAPLLPKMINKEYKKKDVTYIVLTRRERFDLYGKYWGSKIFSFCCKRSCYHKTHYCY